MGSGEDTRVSIFLPLQGFPFRHMVCFALISNIILLQGPAPFPGLPDGQEVTFSR